MRILDISDLTNIQTLKHIRLFKKHKAIDLIDINYENDLIAVGSKKSRKIFFISCAEN